MKTQNAAHSAHQNAKIKVEFRIHLFTYLAVNTLLGIINMTLSPGYVWVIWPILGWGIGLASHALNVHFATNSSLKDRMIEKEEGKLAKRGSVDKTYLVIALATLTASLQAQDYQSAVYSSDQSEISYKGYGGPLTFATGLNNASGICIGGKGGALISDHLVFGGLGFGMVNPLDFAGNKLSDVMNVPLEMTFGAGGVFFEYIVNPGNRIEFSVPLNFMAGGVHVYEVSTETEIESSALFILEPGINIDLKISDFYSQSLFISYRQSIGSSLVNLGDADISGLNVGLLFKFRN
jgi:hypothetical protein